MESSNCYLTIGVETVDVRKLCGVTKSTTSNLSTCQHVQVVSWPLQVKAHNILSVMVSDVPGNNMMVEQWPNSKNRQSF